jgi:hypothetical protein
MLFIGRSHGPRDSEKGGLDDRRVVSTWSKAIPDVFETLNPILKGPRGTGPVTVSVLSPAPRSGFR